MSMNPKDDKVQSNKFFREGAKYVCKMCKKKFFGKNEVEACYDGHEKKSP